MSNIDKQALRERYSPKPVPECHICGEEMTIQRMSASRITYGCTGESDDGYFKFGRIFADEHYEKSRVTVVDVSDPDVLALLDELDELDELEHYKSREERVTKLVLDNSTSWDVLYEKLEAAERRIANNERVMRAVVEAASIRGIRPFEGIECDPPTLEENAEACGDAMSARIRELEANPPKPHHNGLMQISNELVQARQRIAELERSETQLINERDDAESALNDAYKAVMGQAPEWSNWFSFGNAIDEIELACELWRNQTDDVIQFRQRIAELEAKLETADKLQDSAFRDGLKAGFSYGQTDDQSGFAQCMSAYSTRTGIKVKGE
ncbi:TolC family protein [Salmonella enterica]|nr:TolC family protein [Salmonella enterica]